MVQLNLKSPQARTPILLLAGSSIVPSIAFGVSFFFCGWQPQTSEGARARALTYRTLFISNWICAHAGTHVREAVLLAPRKNDFSPIAMKQIDVYCVQLSAVILLYAPQTQGLWEHHRCGTGHHSHQAWLKKLQSFRRCYRKGIQSRS